MGCTLNMTQRSQPADHPWPLQTPTDQGEVLVVPSPAAMRTALDEGRARQRQWRFSLASVDVQQVRAELRRCLAGASDDQPVIVTGHQPEFIHAGIWAKEVVASRFAQATDGVAVNLVVDSDAPKQHALDVPHVDGEAISLRRALFAEGKVGRAFECIRPMHDDLLNAFASTIRNTMSSRFDSTALPEFLRGLEKAKGDFVDQMIAGTEAVDHQLGVFVKDRRISKWWYGSLFGEMLQNAARFRACYNNALADYRTTHGIRGRQRPMPDLIESDQRTELPVWILRHTGSRGRLFVEAGRGTIDLFDEDVHIGAVPNESKADWQSVHAELDRLQLADMLRPRALTLTLWARLLLGDFFIHGIGGARYDRITDAIIAAYFGIEPPPMACVSATLRLSLPHGDTTKPTRQQLQRRLRDLRFNPQRFRREFVDAEDLLQTRQAAVARSSRLRRERPHDRIARRDAFDEIRRTNDRIVSARPDLMRDVEQAMARASDEAVRDRIAMSREHFFALHDTAALRELCDRIPAASEFGV